MLTDLRAFGERLREERKAKDLNQEDFAALGGVRKNSQVLYEGGKTAPTVEYLYKLQDHGVDISYLITGVRAGEEPIGARVREELRRYALASAPRSDEDLVEVAEIDVRLGLGGIYMDEPAVPEMRIFSRTWLRNFTDSPPDQLYWARGEGNSMAPTINDGEIVLIDRRQQSPHFGDLIWAFAFGDVGMIKRLRPLPDGTVELLSDNQSIPPHKAVEGEVHIFGRVVAVVKRI